MKNLFILFFALLLASPLAAQVSFKANNISSDYFEVLRVDRVAGAPNTLVAYVTRNGAMLSTNNGQSWAPMPGLAASSSLRGYVISGGKVVFVSSDNKYWTFENGRVNASGNLQFASNVPSKHTLHA